MSEKENKSSLVYKNTTKKQIDQAINSELFDDFDKFDHFFLSNWKKIVWSAVGILIVIGTLIKINPLKIDPIGHFSNWLVSTITKDLSEKIDGMNDKIDENNKRVQRQIDSIESKIDKIDYAIDENKAVEARNRILRFGDEVSHGKNHSRDHFQQVLFDITNYNKGINKVFYIKKENK